LPEASEPPELEDLASLVALAVAEVALAAAEVALAVAGVASAAAEEALAAADALVLDQASLLVAVRASYAQDVACSVAASSAAARDPALVAASVDAVNPRALEEVASDFRAAKLPDLDRVEMLGPVAELDVLSPLPDAQAADVADNWVADLPEHAFLAVHAPCLELVEVSAWAPCLLPEPHSSLNSIAANAKYSGCPHLHKDLLHTHHNSLVRRRHLQLRTWASEDRFVRRFERHRRLKWVSVNHPSSVQVHRNSRHRHHRPPKVANEDDAYHCLLEVEVCLHVLPRRPEAVNANAFRLVS